MTSFPQLRFPYQDSDSSTQPEQDVSVKQQAAAAAARARLRLQEQAQRQQQEQAQRQQTDAQPATPAQATPPPTSSLWGQRRPSADVTPSQTKAAASASLTDQGAISLKPSVPNAPVPTPPSPAALQNSNAPAPLVPPQSRADPATPIIQEAKQKTVFNRLDAARNAGAVIEGDQLIPHPDGKGGVLHHTGFALPTFRGLEQDPHIPYRNDHGRQYKIYARDMRRLTDPGGKASYHFMVDGSPVSVPEGEQPLLQIDAKGRRSTQAKDGTVRDLGYDPNAAARLAIDPREQAAREPGEQKLAETKVNELGVIGDALQRGLKKEDVSDGFYQHLRPDVAEPLRLRDANTLFLQQEYPDVPVEDLRRNYNAYRDDYVSRNYDLPGGVDDKTFNHLNEQKLEQRKRVNNAAATGVSSAMTHGMKLQAMSEWLKTHPNAGKDEQAAWGRTYKHVQSLLDPYRSLVHQALDGGEHEQRVLLDTLADLPELHRELIMRYAATAAQQRGGNHMLGVADTVGASAQRTLTDMFTSVERIPWSLKTQVEKGQTSFNGPITSMDQALKALSADLQDPRHNYGRRVQQADMLPLRALSDEEKSIMTQALQRETRQARTECDQGPQRSSHEPDGKKSSSPSRRHLRL
jgi:hypothetical protein